MTHVGILFFKINITFKFLLAALIQPTEPHQTCINLASGSSIRTYVVLYHFYVVCVCARVCV